MREKGSNLEDPTPFSGPLLSLHPTPDHSNPIKGAVNQCSPVKILSGRPAVHSGGAASTEWAALGPSYCTLEPGGPRHPPHRSPL